MEPDGMTAQSLPRSLPHPRTPRPGRIRSIGLLVASAAIVVAGQAVTTLRGPEAPAVPAVAAPGAPVGVAPVGPPPAVEGPVSAPGAPFAAAPGSLAQIDRSIRSWTANLAANEADFISARNLAVLYEGRARLSGDISDYARASEAATRSLSIEPRQLDVQALHARLLLATHDFAGALAEAQRVDSLAPNQPAVLAILGDARLELGDVDGAETLYARIETLAPGPAVTARQARIAFLRGDSANAVSLAEAAHGAARADGETGPALSWYAYLAGTMSLSAGEPEEAVRWFDRAVDEWPASYLALAGRARAAAALGDTAAAIADYRASVEVAPQPDALTALGDLLALRGDAAAAEEQYATVEAIARLQAGDGGLVYNRQLALFLVDHHGDAAEALTLAERELEARKDVYGYDAYAWALLANGRAAEADAAISTALATGTRDARVLFHAGEIAHALGHDARARTLLEASLAIRGALDPLSASRAAAALAVLP
jgi:tetratricopeptide (TPR) repeat protein